ncbi:alpha-mannosidase [Flavobacterium cyanobacteriorum]|uniref:Alpha-mannosidase n=1 Tax=Flavobacterium cyanobacteriorum TaxID=2022802 RepID=A0A255Z3K3_9FLAO|nr:alpha/beta hydrolase-fold protein [Flavobacterium cyanobacteriorum]OYQ36058.1 alpha-mannosidase [Flavobacterium cyanobacteriorum]
MNQTTEKGTVQEFTINSPQLSREKHIWVYLPYNYSSSGKLYPVVYMHDGQRVFDHAESPKRDWHVEEKLNDLHSEAIIVGIEHGGSTHRIDEMTPYPNEKYGGGHADDYLEFIINTLMPHIEGNYRVLTGKDNTTIFGASVGGLISFYALLKFPGVFGSAGVFSPSFWFSEEIFTLIRSINKIEGRIYFMAGDHESRNMVPDLEEMEQLVLERVTDRSQVYKRIVHGGHHNEKLWRKEFKNAYIWLMD